MNIKTFAQSFIPDFFEANYCVSREYSVHFFSDYEEALCDFFREPETASFLDAVHADHEPVRRFNEVLRASKLPMDLLISLIVFMDERDVDYKYALVHQDGIHNPRLRRDLETTLVSWWALKGEWWIVDLDDFHVILPPVDKVPENR